MVLIQSTQKNLDKGRYKYFEELFSDIQLIWSNCKTYNVSGSEIFKLAENMERRAKKLVKDLKVQLKIDHAGADAAKGGMGSSDDEDYQKAASKGKDGVAKVKNADDDDEDFGFDPDRYVPFKEKVELSALITKATKEGLTQVVEYLLQNQPEAVDDLGNDRLQIKVDQIEKEAFYHCRDVLSQNQQEGGPTKRQKTK